MMGYLDRLKALDSEKRPPSLLQKPQKDPFYSFYSTQGEHFPEIEAVNDAPGDTATHTDHETPEPAWACSTCAHVTRRGGCGEPVASGLSDVVGVIRYSPDQGATCPAWLPRLDADLERRILAMAERWHYTGDDLAIALNGARTDPEGWLRTVAADEAGAWM